MFSDSPNFRCSVPIRSSCISTHVLSLCVQEAWSQTPSISREGESCSLPLRKQTDKLFPEDWTEFSKNNGFAGTDLEGSELKEGSLFGQMSGLSPQRRCVSQAASAPPQRWPERGGILMVPEVSWPSGRHTAAEPLISAVWLSARTDVTFCSVVLGQLTVVFLQGSDLVLTPIVIWEHLHSWGTGAGGPVCEADIR